MAIKLIVQLFEGKEFTGKNRFIITNEAELASIGFNDAASSARIMMGKEYQPGDVVRFYKNTNFSGKFVEVGPGEYPDLSDSPIHLDNRISSIEIKSVFIPKADPIYLIVNVFKDKDFKGRHRTYLYSEPALSLTDFDDEITSLQVIQGPDYNGHVVTLYQNSNYSGTEVPPGQIGPNTSIPNLRDREFGFNDKISSIRIYHPDDKSL